MRQTMIIHPLDKKTADRETKIHKDNWKSIKNYLNDLKEDENMSIDELFLNLNNTEENYLLAISSSLTTPTVSFKRNPNEVRINNYNPACFTAWRANMDIQFVLDVYACAV